MPESALIPESAETSLAGRPVGSLFVLAGLLVCLAGVASAWWTFHGSGRILAFWPSLAEQVSIAELSRRPARYDGRWVAVSGRLWRVKGEQALLIPPRHGHEMRTLAEVRALVRRGVHHGLSALEVSRKAVPRPHLAVELQRRGGRANLVADRAVTVLGELHQARRAPPRITVVRMKHQRSTAIELFTLILHGILSVLLFGAGLVLLRAGARIGRR